MSSTIVRRIGASLPVLLCVLILPLCALVIRPCVEIGIVDDFSYIRSAQLLAQTGRIVYNGWATAMLGWQLYLGALMIKLFGFSFTAPRVATLLVGMGTAGLMQRLYVRLGIRDWNSAAIAILFLSTPPWLATTFSFMSDVYGMLVLLGCCYCCVRALQAEREGSAAAWVCAAALGAGLGGTARQIAWVGVLAMVPSALWLLRRNRKALLLGGISAVLGIAMIPICMHWFSLQPYSIPESISAQGLSLKHLVRVAVPDFLEQIGFELLFLMMPLLLCFLPLVGRSRRSIVALSLVVSYWVIRIPHLYRGGDLMTWAVPYLFNNLWFSGWEDFPSYVGRPALLLTYNVRLLLTILVFAAEAGLISLLFLERPGLQMVRAVASTSERGSRQLSVEQLAVLFGPCTFAYVILLLPRFLAQGLLDRYLLFPEAVLLGAIILVYQHKVRPALPAAAWALISVFVTVNTMGMHDTFNLFRAQTRLLERLQLAGVSRLEVDGGTQFNGWSEILQTGHLNDPRIRFPAGAFHPVKIMKWSDTCHTPFLELMPSVHGRYVVSFDPNACGGRTGYEESFSTWLGPRRESLYVVKGRE